MARPRKRLYRSTTRQTGAEETKDRILSAARALFSRKGIDQVTIEQIGKKAGVAGSTVYAVFQSKEGILRALMRAALFGSAFQTAQRMLDGVTDGSAMIALTPQIARAIYESESEELGLLRGASSFSPALRKMETEFEQLRYDLQEQRLRLLFQQGQAREGLSIEEARRLLWMYTSREIFRMLVIEGGWSADRYQSWLKETLVTTLVRDGCLPT
jgi:AcrR family transcriptional regulator